MNQNGIQEAIRSSGLKNRIVCLHSSLRSFGHVDGGADTVVEAFLAEGCTLLVPAFHFAAQTVPPDPSPWQRNGGAEEETKGRSSAAIPFSPTERAIEPGMGAIPRAVVSHNDAVRGLHSLNSLAAVGPSAAILMAAQTNEDVYGPYRVAAENPDSVLLLIGVDLTKATPLHYAEQLAGRSLFRRWALQKDGTIQEVTIGSCSNGFEHLSPVVAPWEQSMFVGESYWRWFPLTSFLTAAAGAIRVNQGITHCHRSECLRCDDAVAGGPTPNFP